MFTRSARASTHVSVLDSVLSYLYEIQNHTRDIDIDELVENLQRLYSVVPRAYMRLGLNLDKPFFGPIRMSYLIHNPVVGGYQYPMLKIAFINEPVRYADFLQSITTKARLSYEVFRKDQNIYCLVNGATIPPLERRTGPPFVPCDFGELDGPITLTIACPDPATLLELFPLLSEQLKRDIAHTREVDNAAATLYIHIADLPREPGYVVIEEVLLDNNDRLKFVHNILSYQRARSGAAAAPVPSAMPSSVPSSSSGRGRKAMRVEAEDDIAELRKLFLNSRMARNKGALMSSIMAGSVASFLPQDKPLRKPEADAGGALGGHRLKRKSSLR